jgi:hypothetical protein
MTVTLDPATAKITFSSDRDHSSETYAVEGLDKFAKLGRGTLTFTGSAKRATSPSMSASPSLCAVTSTPIARKPAVREFRAKTSNFAMHTLSPAQNLLQGSKVFLSTKESS